MELVTIGGKPFLKVKKICGTTQHHFSANGNFCYRYPNGALAITGIYEKYKDYHFYRKICPELCTETHLLISKD